MPRGTCPAQGPLAATSPPGVSFSLCPYVLPPLPRTRRSTHSRPPPAVRSVPVDPELSRLIAPALPSRRRFVNIEQDDQSLLFPHNAGKELRTLLNGFRDRPYCREREPHNAFHPVHGQADPLICVQGGNN